MHIVICSQNTNLLKFGTLYVPFGTIMTNIEFIKFSPREYVYEMVRTLWILPYSLISPIRLQYEVDTAGSDTHVPLCFSGEGFQLQESLLWC